MEVKTYTCDIKNCGENCNPVKKKIQVIFITEQTEGRGSKPYLSDESLHLCQKHEDFLLEGNYIWGAGAQGYNDFWFKENKIPKIVVVDNKSLKDEL